MIGPIFHFYIIRVPICVLLLRVRREYYYRVCFRSDSRKPFQVRTYYFSLWLLWQWAVPTHQNLFWVFIHNRIPNIIGIPVCLSASGLTIWVRFWLKPGFFFLFENFSKKPLGKIQQCYSYNTSYNIQYFLSFQIPISIILIRAISNLVAPSCEPFLDFLNHFIWTCLLSQPILDKESLAYEYLLFIRLLIISVLTLYKE